MRAVVRQVLDDETSRVHRTLARHVPPGADVDVASLATYVVATAQALAVLAPA